MPVTTDAVILGASTDFTDCSLILDIGTGTGLLSLMLAQRYPKAEIMAIEPDSLSFECARLNFENSKWASRLKAECCKVQDFIRLESFDGIICNPPFFDNQLLSENARKRMVRHTITLNHVELLLAVKMLLNDEGRAFILIPAIHQKQVMQAAKTMELFITEITEIRSRKSKAPQLLIFRIEKKELECRHKRFITYENESYSLQALEIFEPFYL